MALIVSHSVKAHELGGGIPYAAFWDGITPPEEADYFDLGNCTEFTYNVSVETVEHKSRRGGQLVTDLRVVKEKGYTVSFTLDEPTIVNLALFLKGTIDGNDILALENPNQEIALKFVSDNDVGENSIAYFWRMTVDPGGDYSVISHDDFKTLQFSGTGLADTDNHPTNEYFKVTKIDVTTA